MTAPKLDRKEVLDAIKWFGWQNDGRWATPEMANLWERIASMGTQPASAPLTTFRKNACPKCSSQDLKGAGNQWEAHWTCRQCRHSWSEYGLEVADAQDSAAAATPIPAAPRVGDDGLPREPTRNMCHAGATDPMVHEYVRLVEAAGGEILGKFSSPVRAPIHGVMLCYRVWQLMYDAALSAPPAASADEREDDTDNMVCYWCGKRDAELQGDDSLDDGPGGAWFVQCRECHATGPIMQTEPEALTAWKSGPGYRKLAPAQSVGQSAAQGVGDAVTPELRRAWLERLLAEAVQLAELGTAQAGSDAHLSRNTWLKLARSATKHIRLSALPKGQDDE